MSTPVPPSAPPPAAAPAAPPAASVSVSPAPEALLRLVQGETLEVRMLARVAAAMAQAAEAGPDLPQLTLRLPPSLPPLPETTKVLLQMVAARGETAQLRIVSIDGKPLPQALADLTAQARPGTPLQPPQAQAPQGQTPTAAPTAPPPGAVSLGQGTPMDAVVLRTPVNGMPLPGGPSLVQGSALSLRLLPTLPALPPGTTAGTTAPNATPPAAAPGLPSAGQAAPTGTAPPPGPSPTPGSAASPPPSPSPLPAAGGPPSIPPGTAPPPAPGASPAPGAAPASGPTTAPAPATAPSAPPSAPPSPGLPPGQGALPGRLEGIIAAPNAGGPTVIRAGDLMIALGNRVDLTAGTRVSLEIIAHTPPPAPAPALPATPLAQPLTALPPGPGASSWPTLSDSLDLLARTDPQAARQLASALPGADQRLLSNTLTYMAAIRLGDARPWLGDDPLRALERAGPRGRSLAHKLGQEVKELGQRARDTGGSDWRVLQMPFAAGPTIDRIEIITRRTWAREVEEDDENQRRKGGQGGGQRFLVNVSLSATGPLQIDGLYTKARRTLDMVIRTHTPLPDHMRQDILRLHARNAAAIDMAGSVTFDVAERFPGPEEDGGQRTLLA